MQELKETPNRAEHSLQLILEGFNTFSTENNITLNTPLTAKQFTELNTGIEEHLLAWKSKTFMEYVNYHHTKIFTASNRPGEDSSEDKYALFLSEADTAYQSYKSNSPTWFLSLEMTDASPELVDFIIMQLQNKRLHALLLNQTYSNTSLDRILQACMPASLRLLRLPQNQEILDYQAETLLQGQFIISYLNGKRLSVHITNRFLEGDRLMYVDNPHFHIRHPIRYQIQQLRHGNHYSFELKHAELYQSEEISQLTEQLTRLPREKSITLNLDSSFETPEWAQFFTRVLGQTALVRELTITTEIFSEVILNALINACTQNESLRKVTIKINNQELLSRILHALAFHTKIIDLCIRGSCLLQGEAFKTLLVNTKSLRILDLNHRETGRVVDEDTLLGVALGLEENKSLLKLYCIEIPQALSPNVLQAFSRALSCSFNCQFLTDFSCNLGLDRAAIAGFIKSLRQNSSLLRFNANFPDDNSQDAVTMTLIRNRSIKSMFFPDIKEIATVFVQALMTNHPILSYDFVFLTLFTFLRPSLRVNAEDVKIQINLIQSKLSQFRGYPITLFAKKMPELALEKGQCTDLLVPLESKTCSIS